MCYSVLWLCQTLAINYLEGGVVSLAHGPDASVVGCFVLCTWREDHSRESMLQKKFLTSWQTRSREGTRTRYLQAATPVTPFPSQAVPQTLKAVQPAGKKTITGCWGENLHYRNHSGGEVVFHMQTTIIKIRVEINEMEINKTKCSFFDKKKLNHIDKALLLYYLDVQRKTQQKA